MNLKTALIIVSFVAGTLFVSAPAFAGIQVGGQEAAPANGASSGGVSVGGIRQGDDTPTSENKTRSRRSSAQPAADAPVAGGIRQAEPVNNPNADTPEYQQGDLLKMADEFRARYRRDKQAMYGEDPEGHEHRYGFVVAFFDGKSLVNPTLGKQLGELEKVEGIQFKVYKSEDNLVKNYKDYTKEELERLAKIELPMVQDDTGGRVAENFKVTKFPTVLYETPSGEMVSFYVPNTMDSVFRRIRQETRKVEGSQ